MLLALALVTLLFLAGETTGLVIQVAAIGVLATAAYIAWLRLDGLWLRPTTLEYVLLGICLMSGVSLLNSDLYFQAGFTAAYAVALTCAAILARTLPLPDLMRAGAIAFLGIAILSVVRFPSELAIALNPASPDRYAVRLAAGLHPNLAGFIFGAGIAFNAYGAATSRHILRYLFVAGAIGSALLQLAASHRSSILAVLFSTAIVGIVLFRNLSQRLKTALFSGTALLAVMAIISLDEVIYYLSTVLELDSDTRGWGSGGTGRIDLWAQGVDYIFSDAWRIIFGSGLRSASSDIIGFYTENSYITLVIESGIFLGGLLSVVLIVSSARMLNRVNAHGTLHKAAAMAAAWLLIYALLQSIFNRYLFAIGNSLSLILLILYIQTALILRENAR